MRLVSSHSISILALVCVSIVLARVSIAQTCIDDDGDGWGWNPETNSSCQVSISGTPDLARVGGIKVSWPANSASQNVSEYEAVGQINGGEETGFYRGSAAEFSVRFTDVAANFNDTVCVRVRAVRVVGTGDNTQETFSAWSEQSCITLPDAPLLPPQLIELSLIE